MYSNGYVEQIMSFYLVCFCT